MKQTYHMIDFIYHLIREYVIPASHEIFSLNKLNIVMKMYIFYKIQYILIFFMQND